MWTKLLIGEEFGLNKLRPCKRDSNTFLLLKALKMLALQQVEKNGDKSMVIFQYQRKEDEVTETRFKFSPWVLTWLTL